MFKVIVSLSRFLFTIFIRLKQSCLLLCGLSLSQKLLSFLLGQLAILESYAIIHKVKDEDSAEPIDLIAQIAKEPEPPAEQQEMPEEKEPAQTEVEELA